MVHVIMFIARAAGSVGERLHEAVRKACSGCSCEVCQSGSELEARLHLPARFGELELFILLADTRHRLNELLQLKTLLDGRWILLILPDSEENTRGLGFQLFPRFVAHISDNFEDVEAVIKKKIELACACMGNHSIPNTQEAVHEKTRGHIDGS